MDIMTNSKVLICHYLCSGKLSLAIARIASSSVSIVQPFKENE